jgi:hypothetical protein
MIRVVILLAILLGGCAEMRDLQWVGIKHVENVK